MTFTLYDYADGSKGATSLELQRIEHLEMWMLLGDPAMRIPLPPAQVKLRLPELAKSEGTVKIEGTVPACFEGSVVQLTLEKSLRKPKELSVSGDENQPAPTATWMGVIGYANDAYILDKTETIVKKGVFSGQLKLPEIVTPAEIIVRAYVTNGHQDAMNIETLELH